MTDPPEQSWGRHHTVGRRLAPTSAALALALACAAPQPPPAPLSSGDAPAPGSVRVRLAFGPDADLDLYVTDPLLETVYFANTPSASGGFLEEDVRCDAEAPRVETALFPHARAGRYRVGVDFPVRCRRIGEPAPFVVVVETSERRWEQRGEVAFGQFLSVVLEVEVE